MAPLELLRTLSHPNNTKLVLLVLDGLGGLPIQPGGATELEAARRSA
jgi:2,3-bisphosphoglycerate-independent phosphoglycerate mutase|tara:strand:- start:1534 stop:1674 length:141 start_codon:yes stop_codon:yes gene_type:complete